MKVAISAVISQGRFLVDCPAVPARGLESTGDITLAKRDFADQAAVDSWVTARGGTTSQWKVLDLGAAGVG
jgi:hypothetical protein